MRNARHFGLRKKIGFVALVIFCGFASVISLVLLMGQQAVTSDSRMAKLTELILYAQDVQKKMLEANKDELRLLLVKDPAIKKDAEQKIVLISLALDKMATVTDDSTVLAHAKQIKELTFSYTLQLNELADELEAQQVNRSVVAGDSVQAEFNEISAGIEREVDGIMATVKALAQHEASEKGQLLARISTLIVSIAVVIGVLSIAAVLLIFWRSVVIPIRQLLAVVSALAAGDFTQKLMRRKRMFPDEIDEMLDKFAHMQTNLLGMLRDIHSFSQDVSHASGHLLGNASQVSLSAEEIASASMEVAASMNQQARFIDHNVQQIAELSERIDEIERSTSVVTLATKDADDAVHAGEHQLGGLLEQMKRIEQAIGETVETLALFEHSSMQMEGIVHIMSEISDQTQLLALNAAIEAARVGHQGRGFAIVAEEIHKLSAVSKQSTAKISGLIQTISQHAITLIGQMEHSKAEVACGVDFAEQAGTNFRQMKTGFVNVFQQLSEIDGAVQTIFRFGHEVNRSSREMWTALQEINSGMESISAGTEEQTAATQEIAASLEKLAAEANALYKSVDRFTLSAD